MEINPLILRFDTYRDYRQQILTLVQLTRIELDIFDPDLKETGLHSGAGADALTELLSGRRNIRIRMVLHNPDYIERNCPRVMGLLAHYGHALFVRQSPEDLRSLTDCFIAADGQHAAIRFHVDHARGKLLVGQGDEVRNWQQRFEQLWEISSPAIAVTTLGL